MTKTVIENYNFLCVISPTFPFLLILKGGKFIQQAPGAIVLFTFPSLAGISGVSLEVPTCLSLQ